MADFKIITAVTAEPLTLSEVKLYLRLIASEDEEYENEDDLLSSLITAAREYCEAFTRRALAAQTLEAVLPYFPAQGYIVLPRPPLQSVSSVKYRDSSGSAVELTVGDDYLVDTDGPGRIVLPYGKTWPSFEPYPFGAVRVRYEAGYDADTIPASIQRAMLYLIGHWYENREAVVLGSAATVGKEIDFAVKSLLYIWKAGWF